MTGMLAGHEGAARRGAHGITAVVLGKSHTFRRQLVDMRCFDLFLSIAPQFGVAEVVGQDEYDVGAVT